MEAGDDLDVGDDGSVLEPLTDKMEGRGNENVDEKSAAAPVVPKKPTASFHEILKKAVELRIVHPSALTDYITRTMSVSLSVPPSTVMNRVAILQNTSNGMEVVPPEAMTMVSTFNSFVRIKVNQNRMEFADFKQLSSALKRLAMHCGFEIRVKYSSKRNKRWECREPGCPFVLSGYRNKDNKIHVTDIELAHFHRNATSDPQSNEGTESAKAGSGDERPTSTENRLTRNTTLSNELVLAGVFDSEIGQQIILKDPEELKLKDIQGILMAQFGSQISASMASRAKRKLVELFYETSDTSYQLLRPFFEKVVIENPGSFYIIDHVPSSNTAGIYEYGRCLLGIGPAIRMLADSAPVLVLESCSMNTEMHKAGMLLMVSTRDYNSDMILLAMAHVPVDDELNWRWFLQQLQENSLPLSKITTFISDGSPGIARAVSQVYPNQPHRFSLEHMLPLLATTIGTARLGPELEHLIVQMANSVNMDRYMESFQVLWRLNKDLGRYLEGIPKEHWVLAAVLDRGWPLLKDISLKTCVGEFAKSPLGSLMRSCNLVPCFYLFLLSIQKTFIARHVQSRSLPDNVLLPNQQTIMIQRNVESGRYEIQECRPQEVYFAQYHTVSTPSNSFKLVNIVARTCSCGEWQQNHIPCVHAIAVLNCLSKNVLDYVSEWYFTGRHKVTYSRGMSIVAVPPIDLKPDLTMKAPSLILQQLKEAQIANTAIDPAVRSKPGPRPRKRKDLSS
ncbi:hypothetical protein THRCLA_21722 [Thraustotheca clavata]|uniref:SWIM-type domain-containing protein n=1 Tax=Thraustotheca clavata TaxID=74557 RepID=A0A1V9ZQE0_9STRA|nr:hypothetical protein THRCLA_21722 [Thraustotheca clavata]